VEVLEMSQTLHRPAIAGRERHQLAADAFLWAAMIFLVGLGVPEGIAYLLAGGEPASWTPPVWLQVMSALSMPVAAIGGPLLAWWTYDRHLAWREIVAAVVGAVLGGVGLATAFLVLSLVRRAVPGPAPEGQGPWLLIVVAALAVVAFLATPVVAAVGDLARSQEHARRDWLRLTMVAIALVAVVLSVALGGETAEVGIFLLLPAVPAAVAAVAMDWWRSEHERRAAG
jgi:hypothetical protein